MTPRAQLEAIFSAALRAVDPGRRVAAECARSGLGPEAGVRVLAIGKAAAAMAGAAEQALGARLLAGLAVTKDGHAAPLSRIRLLEAAHPVPDARSEAAGREVMEFAAATPPDALLWVLLSGGTSPLVARPLPGLELDDVARTTSMLLAAGAPIQELNAVRKHLCDVAGGRLARGAGGARIELWVVSDVLGDRLDVIGSGPCSPDPSRYADARAVLAERSLLERVPAAVRAHLEAGVRGERDESAKPGDAALARVRARVLLRNADAVAAAEARARELGLDVRRVTGALQGEARVAGRRLAALARSLRPAEAPRLLLAGGETTVTVRGDGRGGRNQELALAAALEWERAGGQGACLLAAGTDGSDGPTDAAGAHADGQTVARGAAVGVRADAALARNDAYHFFAAEGGLLRTGPTGTNVMDLALLRVP